MSRSVPKCGLRHGGAFVGSAARYWVKVFPVVARELDRRREQAVAIPDPLLRRLALESLQRKRCNLEGAAALELLAGRASGVGLIRALTACQTMCDYLDVLAEQPTVDPVANGRSLHRALIVGLCPGEPRSDYYAHHTHSEDGGYLDGLVGDVRAGLTALPGFGSIEEPLGRMAQRIATYQHYNHGDAHGSYEPFREWASTQAAPGSSLNWWEAGAGAGSTLGAYALIASAAHPRLSAQAARDIEGAYFPWVGALHSLLDSVADLHEDAHTGERGLVSCYASAEQAAARMDVIAVHALRHVSELPDAGGNMLILLGMASFYMWEASRSGSAHARAVVPALRRTLGRLAAPAMWMIGLRAVARPSGGKLPSALPPCTPYPPAYQVPR